MNYKKIEKRIRNAAVEHVEIEIKRLKAELGIQLTTPEKAVLKRLIGGKLSEDLELLFDNAGTVGSEEWRGLTRPTRCIEIPAGNHPYASINRAQVYEEILQKAELLNGEKRLFGPPNARFQLILNEEGTAYANRRRQ